MLRTLATPRWIGITVSALVVIVAFGALSYWQWQRAQRDEVVQRAPVPASTVLFADRPPAESSYGVRVEVSGTYDVEQQVLVDHGGSAYWIVTPLRPMSGPAVPVVRGTVSSPQAAAASVPPPGVVRVVGLAQPFEGDPGTPDTTDDGITPRLTASGLALPYPATQGWVALESQDPATAGAALGAVQPPFGGEAPGGLRIQNAGYAVQWVLFAGFVAFLWWRMLREESGGPTAPASAPSAPEVY